MTAASLTPREFLTQLWGDELPGPRLRIQTWSLATKRAQLLRAPVGATGIAGQTDIYTGVTLAHDQRITGRPAAADSRAIAGLWLDLDVNGGPDRKTGACPTIDDAERLARAVLEPTITVRSGYGLHAWWLFIEPWVFAGVFDQERAATMAAQWFELHRRAALEQGWHVDHAHDLARLLRLPGTINGKGGLAAPVTGQLCGARWTRVSLAEEAARAGDIDPRIGAPATSTVVQVTVRENAEIPEPKLAAALHNLPEFAATWEHRRSEHWSLSEYDLALCSIAAQLEDWTDQDLADLIVHHRRRFETDSGKASRPDYLRRTIARARQDRTLRAAAYGAMTRAGGARGEQMLNTMAMTRSAA